MQTENEFIAKKIELCNKVFLLKEQQAQHTSLIEVAIFEGFFIDFEKILENLRSIKSNYSSQLAENKELSKKCNLYFFKIVTRTTLVARDLYYYYLRENNKKKQKHYLQKSLTLSQELAEHVKQNDELHLLRYKVYPLNLKLSIYNLQNNKQLIKETFHEAELLYNEINKLICRILNEEAGDIVTFCLTMAESAKKLQKSELVTKWNRMAFAYAHSFKLPDELFKACINLAETYREEACEQLNFKIPLSNRTLRNLTNQKIIQKKYKKELWDLALYFAYHALIVAKFVNEFVFEDVQALLNVIDNAIYVHFNLEDTIQQLKIVSAGNRALQEFFKILKTKDPAQFTEIVAIGEDAIRHNSQNIIALFETITIVIEENKEEAFQNEELLLEKENLSEFYASSLIKEEESAKKLHDEYLEKLSKRQSAKKQQQKAAEPSKETVDANLDKSTTYEETISAQTIELLEEKYCRALPHYHEAHNAFKDHLYEKALHLYQADLSQIALHPLQLIILSTQMTDCFSALAYPCFRRHSYSDCVQYYEKANEAINNAITKIQVLIQQSYEENGMQINKEDLNTLYSAVQISAQDIKEWVDYLHDYIPKRLEFREYTRKLAKARYEVEEKEWKKNTMDLSRKARELVDCKVAIVTVDNLKNAVNFTKLRAAKATEYLELLKLPEELLKSEIISYREWLEIIGGEPKDKVDLQYALAASRSLAEKMRFSQNDKQATIYYRHAKEAASKLNLLNIQVAMADREAVSFDSSLLLAKYRFESLTEADALQFQNLQKDLEKVKDLYQQTSKLYQQFIESRLEPGLETEKNSIEQAEARIAEISHYIIEIQKEEKYYRKFYENQKTLSKGNTVFWTNEVTTSHEDQGDLKGIDTSESRSLTGFI